MTIIYHIADTHVKLGPRWNECTRLLNHFAERVEQDKPDVVVHAGDLFDAKSSPLEMRFSEEWARRIAHVCPLVLIRGNHDAEHEIEGFRRLGAPHPIWAFEEPHVITVAGIAIACMPWPSKAGVVTQASDLSLEQTSDDANEHLRAILRWLGEELAATGLPTMLLMHAMVRGSKTAAGQPLTGCDFELGLEDLSLVGCDVYALGHIHKSQSWQQNGAIFRYSGSPFHTDFGDWYEKSFTKWVFEDGKLKTCEQCLLPAHQMIEVVANYTTVDEVDANPAMYFDGKNICQDRTGVEYKLTYLTAPEHAKAARADARQWAGEQLAAGAYSVQLNPQTQVETRARAAEVANATSDEDKLREFWGSQKEDPGDPLHTRMMDKFHLLKQGT